MTHEEIILDYLQTHESISQMQAFDMGITRLSAVVWKLRHKQGIEVLDRTVTTVNRYGVACNYKQYYLAEGCK